MEPESQPKEREIGPFPFKPLATDEWLGDSFYHERTVGTGEPQGIIPND